MIIGWLVQVLARQRERARVGGTQGRGTTRCNFVKTLIKALFPNAAIFIVHRGLLVPDSWGLLDITEGRCLRFSTATVLYSVSVRVESARPPRNRSGLSCGAGRVQCRTQKWQGIGFAADGTRALLSINWLI